MWPRPLVYDDIYNRAHNGLYGTFLNFGNCIGRINLDNMPLYCSHLRSCLRLSVSCRYKTIACECLAIYTHWNKKKNDDNCDLPLLSMQYFGSINNMNLKKSGSGSGINIPNPQHCRKGWYMIQYLRILIYNIPYTRYTIPKIEWKNISVSVTSSSSLKDRCRTSTYDFRN